MRWLLSALCLLTANAAAAEPACAKLTCRHRSPSQEPDSLLERPDRGGSASGLAVRVAVGALSFALDDSIVSRASLDEEAHAGVSGSGRQERRFAGAPLVSLGLALDQPLWEAPAYGLFLEEHLSLAGIEAAIGDEGGALGGAADVLVGARASGVPVSAALGLSAAVLHVDLADDFSTDEFSFLIGPALLVKMNVQDLPGWNVHLLGRAGGALNGEAGYQSAEVGLSIPL